MDLEDGQRFREPTVLRASEPPRVLKADTRSRRNAIIVVALATLGALLLFPLLEGQFDGIRRGEQPPLADLITLLYLVFIGFALSTSAVGFLVLRIGLRIFKEGEYPWPGMKVIKDTRVRTGTQAQRLAWVYSVSGTVIIISAFAVLWIAVRLLDLVSFSIRI